MYTSHKAFAGHTKYVQYTLCHRICHLYCLWFYSGSYHDRKPWQYHLGLHLVITWTGFQAQRTHRYRYIFWYHFNYRRYFISISNTTSIILNGKASTLRTYCSVCVGIWQVWLGNQWLVGYDSKGVAQPEMRHGLERYVVARSHW